MFGPAEAKKEDHEREVKRLHAKIGELTMIDCESGQAARYERSGITGQMERSARPLVCE